MAAAFFFFFQDLSFSDSLQCKRWTESSHPPWKYAWKTETKGMSMKWAQKKKKGQAAICNLERDAFFSSFLSSEAFSSGNCSSSGSCMCPIQHCWTKKAWEIHSLTCHPLVDSHWWWTSSELHQNHHTNRLKCNEKGSRSVRWYNAAASQDISELSSSWSAAKL